MLTLIAYKNPNADNPACRHSGLGITASNLAEVLNDNSLPALALPVANGEALWSAIASRNDVTHVVICAPFFETAFLEKLCRQFPHVRFTVTYHSNWGFLQQDIWAVKCLTQQVRLQNCIRNFQVSGNCSEFTGATEIAFRTPVFLLPNLYYLHGAPDRKRPIWQDRDLHLGIFGATRVLKNLLTGAVAGIIIGRTIRAQRTFIHTSSGREEHGDGVMQTIRQLFQGLDNFELVEEPWSTWPDFQIRVRQMDLLLQPSFTESFNNVTADGVCEGVASVVGFPISWVPNTWKACPDDAREIAEVGIRLLNDPAAARSGHDALSQHNSRGVETWRRWLTRS